MSKTDAEITVEALSGPMAVYALGVFAFVAVVVAIIVS